MGVQRIQLSHADFDLRDEVASYQGLSASTFKYSTGVEGLTLSNQRGKIGLLPFQGHQIWSAEFFGQRLGMESLVETPIPTIDYLANYGGFVLHCGPRRMGCPDLEAGDDHELHGVLPNARFGHNSIIYGEDEEGHFMSIMGALTDNRRKGLEYSYAARCVTTLHANSSIIDISMYVTNNFLGHMEIMCLEHVNFLPVAGSELVYSAHCTPETVRIREKDPKHAPPPAEFIELRDRIKADPKLHNHIPDKPVYDPEIVLYLKYLADSAGWAHSMQVLPDGYAHYIAHRPDQFPIGVRWMRMVENAAESFPAKSALGLLLPSTAEPEGYAAEKKKGNVIEIPKGGHWSSNIKVGILPPDRAGDMRRIIEDILK